ncbi:MAG: discoidin domain-containing protein [Verrucomicrobiae bacterium]|nr:discoidin domain-containing protein [Verrucomicrobiae bacterium]
MKPVVSENFRPSIPRLAATALALAFGAFAFPDASAQSPPLRALLVAGGCCHDYAGQHKVLYTGIQARANVRVDVVWTDDRSVDPPLPLYEDPNWAKGYDVIIHDECAAGNKDLKVMKHLLDAHQTVPAVHLHCAMHSFRNGTDQWFKHLGLQSTSHGPQEPIRIAFTDKQHPVTAPFTNWTTIREELYNNVKLFDAHPLATGTQRVKDKDVRHVVVWTNEKQGARSFSTTLGHNTETVADPRYLDLITRGLLWACGKLDEDHLQPYTGENKVTFVKAAPPAPKPAPVPQSAGPAPKDATLVKVSASSEESGKHNYTWHAVDGKKNTRWCASNPKVPQWFQIEFEKPQKLTGAKIVWESDNNAYRHKIEGSSNGKDWKVLHDATANDKRGDTESTFSAEDIRFVRVTGTGTSGGWISIREITLTGPTIKSIFPRLDDKQRAAAAKANAEANDPHAKSGNIPPRIIRLTPAEEAAILKDVKVPEGFEATLFAPAATANYPVYVAAAPNGDLYVSSDGNGSLGRNPGRGRVLRLRDTNGDGRADQVTEFVKDVDAPRGLIWDHDRLYLLHPPHISVYFDRDGDGVAEESKVLVRGIAFGFDKRPPDHTTNGIELGADGWIYIAGGDFGFMDASGTDGRHLRHRAGGVIRFRPDGTGLEIFATGTRNILGTPMSPLLDLFARDNTNDGGGWDVRFHHFSGLEDHGYPRLYKNFGGEHIHPLADYGGGSGCGSVYIHEPGFPAAWNNAPFTCDWGRAALFRHAVKRQGATFVETAEPQPFIRVTRPTDADVDGMSRIYQASWKGPATFSWAGPDHGYIARITPKGFQPAPLPDFEKLPDAALIALLESPSQVRALAAQRALLRRVEDVNTTTALLALAGNPSKELRSRVAALYAVTQRGTDSRESARIINLIAPLAREAALSPFVLRALGDMGIDQITRGESGPVPQGILVAGLRSDDARTRLEAIIAAARQRNLETASAIAASLGHQDAVIAHTAFQALAQMNADKACFEILDTAASTEAQRIGAGHALMRMHRADVVDQLIARLSTPNSPASHRPILAALCRLYHREAEWTGDSWGTRPDTRGPYYQLEKWEPSDKILVALKSALATAEPNDAADLVREMNRNRIQSDEALARIIDLATSDETHVTAAVAQLAGSDEIPTQAIPLLLKAARNPTAGPMVLAQTIQCLAQINQPEALRASVTALAALEKTRGENKAQEVGRRAFLENPKLDNHHETLETIASESPESDAGQWAHAGLLELASRKNSGPEARAHADQAIDLAWQNPARRVVLMEIAAELRNHHLDDRIRAAMNDFDPAVAKAAQNAAKRLKIEPADADKTPKIGTLKPADALAQVVKMKGDPTLGEAVFIRAACVTCHTTRQDLPQKGPYLGNIANTYRRPDLAEAILNPNKTIAQGFATQIIVTRDDFEYTGFVTREAGTEVTLRDVTAREHLLKKADIARRETLPTSIMPSDLMNAFTVKELASLLDYLEALSKN